MEVTSQLHAPVALPQGMSTVGSFPGIKSYRRVVKMITHLHLVTKSKMVELYLHSPVLFHGVVLN
jgi:hypothetical protein